MTEIKRTRDEFYLFLMPLDSMCPVWAEMYGSDGTHVVAPTPYEDVKTAAAALRSLNPDATIDELCEQADIDECREWARTMPLEQIPDCTDPRCPVWHA